MGLDTEGPSPGWAIPFTSIWAILMGLAWAWVPADADDGIPWLVGYFIVGSGVGALVGYEMSGYYDEGGPIGRWIWRLLTGAFAVVVLLAVVDAVRA